MTSARRLDQNPVIKNASWFKLSNYDQKVSAQPEMWFNQLAIRMDLRNLRNVLRSSDKALAKIQREIYDALVRKTHEQTVLEKADLALFRDIEGFPFPGFSSVLRLADSQSDYVRSLTLSDLMQILDSIKQDALQRAEVAFMNAGQEKYADLSTPSHRDTILSDDIRAHLRGSQIGMNKEYVVIDLRLPLSLVLNQIAQLMDMRVGDLNGIVVPAKQTSAPKCQAWRKSKVLAYLDLQHWIEDISNQKMRGMILETDIANALNIDLGMFKKTTKEHAKVLSDQYSIVFVNLIEAVLHTRRGPVTPRRLPKKRKAAERKN